MIYYKPGINFITVHDVNNFHFWKTATWKPDESHFYGPVY